MGNTVTLAKMIAFDIVPVVELPADDSGAGVSDLERWALKASERIESYQAGWREVLAEKCDGDDRKHCSCVPHLKEGLSRLADGVRFLALLQDFVVSEMMRCKNCDEGFTCPTCKRHEMALAKSGAIYKDDGTIIRTEWLEAALQLIPRPTCFICCEPVLVVSECEECGQEVCPKHLCLGICYYCSCDRESRAALDD